MNTNVQSCSWLYRHRTFGEKFSDTLTFVKLSWRMLFAILSLGLIPLSLVETYCADWFRAFVSTVCPRQSSEAFVADFVWMFVMEFIASAFVIIVVYGVMRLFNEQSSSCPAVADVSVSRFRFLLPFLAKAVVSGLSYFLLLVAALFGGTVLIGLAAGVTTAALHGSEALLYVTGGVVAIMLLLAVPFWVLSIPLYSFESVSFASGVVRSARYGFHTWRGIVGILIVYTLVDIVVTFPFGLLQSSFCGFVGTYISYFVQAMALVTLACQYGHAARNDFAIEK